MSWHKNAYCITGHMCGESTLAQVELYCFCLFSTWISHMNKFKGLVISDALMLVWHHFNAIRSAHVMFLCYLVLVIWTVVFVSMMYLPIPFRVSSLALGHTRYQKNKPGWYGKNLLVPNYNKNRIRAVWDCTIHHGPFIRECPGLINEALEEKLW